MRHRTAPSSFSPPRYSSVWPDPKEATPPKRTKAPTPATTATRASDDDEDFREYHTTGPDFW